MLELRQNKAIKEREWENTPRELGFGGLMEKERGKEKGSVGKVTILRLQLTMPQEVNKHLVKQ